MSNIGSWQTASHQNSVVTYTIYHQTCGIAMGTPFAVTAANAFMYYHERDIIELYALLHLKLCNTLRLRNRLINICTYLSNHFTPLATKKLLLKANLCASLEIAQSFTHSTRHGWKHLRLRGYLAKFLPHIFRAVSHENRREWFSKPIREVVTIGFLSKLGNWIFAGGTIATGGNNSVETTRQRERKLVTISWYTEICFERAYTDVKDKTIFGSTVLLF